MKLQNKRFTQLIPIRKCYRLGACIALLVIFTCTTVWPVVFFGDHCRQGSTCLAGGTGFDMDNFYYYWDVGLCAYLDQLFAGQKVLELGAGYGFYGRCLLRLNASFFPETPVIDEIFFKQLSERGLNGTPSRIGFWVGYEEPSRAAPATGTLVAPLDIGSDFYLDREFDWALSLDTSRLLAIHEDRRGLPRRIFLFCRNIARHARNGIVLSLAVPASVNGPQEDKNSPVFAPRDGRPSPISLEAKLDAALRRFGFVSDDTSQKFLRQYASSPWFRQSLRIYVRVDTGWGLERM